VAEPGPVKLLAFGDSLVHGYGLPAGDSFPEQLQAALAARGRAVEVINAGNSGDTTAAGRARLDWALAEKPDLVLVEFGGNDGLRGIDPGETYRNLDLILGRLAAERLPVLLAGMRAPRNLGPEYVGEFDAVFPRLAAKHGVALYPFFLDGVALDPALNQRDGIHPNAAGVAVIVERIIPALEPLLEAAAQRAGADG
jgi:acyl-CoA thioesterase-1